MPGFTFVLFQIIFHEYCTASRPTKIFQQLIWNYRESFKNKEITHIPLDKQTNIYTRHLMLGSQHLNVYYFKSLFMNIVELLGPQKYTSNPFGTIENLSIIKRLHITL